MSEQVQDRLSQIYKVGEQTIRDQQEKIAQQQNAMGILADRALSAELHKEASALTIELIRSGVISLDSYEAKVAELVAKGEHGIEVAREAHKMVAHEKGASFGIVDGGAEDDKTAEVADEGEEVNEVLDYLEQFVGLES